MLVFDLAFKCISMELSLYKFSVVTRVKRKCQVLGSSSFLPNFFMLDLFKK